MTTEDQVSLLFAAANPVVDPEALIVDQDADARLAEIEQRRLQMDTTNETNHEATKGRVGRMVAAAVVVLALGVGATWLTLRSDEPEPVAVPPEVATVEAAYAALNAGDLDGFLDLLTDSAATHMAKIEEILINANQVTEIVEPCTSGGTTIRGETIVTCVVSTFDDFHGPAGIASTHTDTWLLDDVGAITSRVDDMDLFHQFQFNRAFWQWLQGVHLDVYQEIAPFDLESLPGWNGDAASMRVAVEYVGEFIAQSEVYPLDDGG